MLSEKAEMRVKIAKDVLAALETKRIIAKYGGYVRSDEIAAEGHEYVDDPEDMGSNQFTAPGNCSVCALGGMFVAAVDRNNSLHLKDVYDDWEDVAGDSLVRYLKRWFTIRQLALVETAYEGDLVIAVADRNRPSDEHFSKAYAFYVDNGDSGGLNEYSALGSERALAVTKRGESRMTAIMQNIIDNNGTFKP